MRNMQYLGETIAWLGATLKPHMASFPRPQAGGEG
jgi:hypothetical protein